MRDREAAEAIIELRQYMHPLHHTYYVQEYVERPPRDIRVTVVGDRAVASIYRVAPPGRWKTTIARGGRPEPCELTPELEEISLKAAEAVGGGVLGIDIFESPRGYLVNEVNHAVEFAATVECTKVDVPGLIVECALEQLRK